MREIKFRGWDSKGKIMYYPDSKRLFYGRDDNGDITFFVQIPTETSCPYRDVIPLRYTGIQDKNGKDIYEGDIVKGSQGTGWVYWEDGDPAFYIEFDYHSTGWLTDEYEIIGNIYENPELLK